MAAAVYACVLTAAALGSSSRHRRRRHGNHSQQRECEREFTEHLNEPFWLVVVTGAPGSLGSGFWHAISEFYGLHSHFISLGNYLRSWTVACGRVRCSGDGITSLERLSQSSRQRRELMHQALGIPSALIVRVCVGTFRTSMWVISHARFGFVITEDTTGVSNMRRVLTPRSGLIALMALAMASFSSAALADSGSIRISVIKGGWIIGASGGNGTLNFHGQRYALSIGGLSVGLLFGVSQTNLSGRVSHIRHPSDVEGIYGAAGAGVAVVKGARAIVLTNEKGAVLTLQGREVGLLANADLSGLVISLK